MKKVIQMMILGCVLALAACGEEEVEPTMSSDVADFTATSQDGETITNEDLKGEWWIADFIFTKCTSVCPPMTRNMATLQKDLAEAGVDNVKLISFSVDPDNDTPEVLKEYGDDHGADYANWTFLTGYDFATIEDLSIGSFKSPLEPAPEDDDQVGHGTRFFIVNPEGTVINSYIGTEADTMEQIVNDLQKLQK